jgi:hypothetical protein
LGRFNRLSALAQASLVLCEPNGVLAFKSQVVAIETTLAKLGHLSTGYISPFKNKRHAMNTSLNCRPPGILAAISVVLASIAMPVVADDLMFKLSGDMEVPSVNTAATGEGAITIKPDMSVTGKVMTRGLDGTMAHIHLGKAGTNGPVVITLSKSGNNGWIVPEGSKPARPNTRLTKPASCTSMSIAPITNPERSVGSCYRPRRRHRATETSYVQY